jgi:type IV secretory pathway TraG/TraD family ATPase VirD4
MAASRVFHSAIDTGRVLNAQTLTIFYGKGALVLQEAAVPATRILWGQIVIVLLIVLVAISAATQWTAWRLGFPPQLGRPWFHLWPEMPVYLPPTFFWWWYLYDAYAPRIFLEGAYIAASGGLMSAAAAFTLSIWRARDRAVETYGSARWAKPSEVSARACSDRMASCSDATAGPTCVMTGRSMCCASRQPAPARVSALSFPRS